MPRARATPRAFAFALLTLLACEDLREYAGPWSGELSGDPHLAQGFAPATPITAEITEVTRDRIALTVALPLAPGGAPITLPFVPIRRAAGDVLAEVQLPGEPLRTYFGFVQPPGEAALLTLVSLYPESRMDVRLIRGADELYGVFFLRRVPRSPAPPGSK